MKKDLKKRLNKYLYFTTSLGVIFLMASFSLNSSAKTKEKYLDLQIFSKVLNLVQNYYVEEVDTKKLIYGAIKGMLKELDPHTNFLPPDIYKNFKIESSGEFGGLGIEITVQKGILTIIAPIEDTPAWKAGLKPGDKIIAINDESTKGFNLIEAAQRLKGKQGDIVKLSIFRKGFNQPKTFSIKIGKIKVKSVKYTNLDDGYAYIKITKFNGSTTKNVKKTLKDHIKKHKQVKGLIVDVRQNPGGLLNQAIELSDLFVPEGILVSTRHRQKEKKNVWYATKNGTYEDFPIVVLINEYSASASEIFAGALKDNKRALIVGEKSFGKGSVQSIITMTDGSAFKFTVARYYTPSGDSIQAKGITPDIKVARIDKKTLQEASFESKKIKREEDIVGHLQGEGETKKKKMPSIDFWWSENYSKKKDLSPKETLLSKDFQVLQAYNYLMAWKTMSDFHGSHSLPKGLTKSTDPKGSSKN